MQHCSFANSWRRKLLRKHWLHLRVMHKKIITYCWSSPFLVEIVDDITITVSSWNYKENPKRRTVILTNKNIIQTALISITDFDIHGTACLAILFNGKVDHLDTKHTIYIYKEDSLFALYAFGPCRSQCNQTLHSLLFRSEEDRGVIFNPKFWPPGYLVTPLLERCSRCFIGIVSPCDWFFNNSRTKGDKGPFSHDQLYVTCSRVETGRNLYVFDPNAKTKTIMYQTAA
jgi:hypothetical protein